MGTDGSWGGTGGVIAGLRERLRPAQSIVVYPHDYTGNMEGRVTGRSVSGVENVLFGAPCPGKTLQLRFSGSR